MTTIRLDRKDAVYELVFDGSHIATGADSGSFLATLVIHKFNRTSVLKLTCLYSAYRLTLDLTEPVFSNPEKIATKSLLGIPQEYTVQVRYDNDWLNQFE